MLPSDYQEIGQYLKESRESLRVTREQAAVALHIRAKYLTALEEGDLKDLPGKAYIRGYIRTYAHYLGLNVNEVLDAYAPLLGPRVQELFIPEPTLQQNMPSRALLWLSIIGLILLYCLWYFTYHDRTVIRQVVSEVPSNLMRLLDKTPPVVMDKGWESCLSGDDELCYIPLYERAIMPDNTILYDIQPDHTPPQEP